MDSVQRQRWADGLDKGCAVLGGFLPMGILIGNVGFEGMLALVGLGWLLRTLIAGENPLPWLVKHPLALPWLVIYTVVLLSLAVNGAGGKGAGHDIVYLRHLLFLAAMLDISRRLDPTPYFLLGMGAAVALAAVNLLLAHTIGFDLMGKPATRYSSKLKEAARLAGLFTYLGPMLTAWGFSLIDRSRRARGALLLAGLAATAMMAAMGIRTTLLATAFGFCAWGCHWLLRHFGRKALVVIVLAVLVTGALSVAYVSRQPMKSMHDRYSIYKVTWAMVRDNALLGVGVSGFQDAYAEMAASGRVAPYIAPDGEEWLNPQAMHAHNLYLMVLACTGVLGLGAFLWLFVNIVRLTLLRAPPRLREGLVVWPTVLLVVGLTNLHFYGDWYQALMVYLTAFTGIVAKEGLQG